MTTSTAKTNLLLLITLLAMATGLVGAPDPIPPIKELKDLNAKRTVSTDATRSKPIILKSTEAAAKYFAKDSLAKITEAVDFEKQMVLVFAWYGSGQDRMKYTVSRSTPEQILFSYMPGRTRDRRPHIKIFALQSQVVWKME